MVYACPECDHSHITHRMKKRPRFRCPECKHEFDAPVERKDYRRTGDGPSQPADDYEPTGLVAKLNRMDPEDLGLSPTGERAD